MYQVSFNVWLWSGFSDIIVSFIEKDFSTTRYHLSYPFAWWYISTCCYLFQRGKKPPEDLCPVESIKAFSQVSTHPVWKINLLIFKTSFACFAKTQLIHAAICLQLQMFQFVLFGLHYTLTIHRWHMSLILTKRVVFFACKNRCMCRVNIWNLPFQGLHSASVPGILALDLQDSDPSKAITGMYSWHYCSMFYGTMLISYVPWESIQWFSILQKFSQKFWTHAGELLEKC